MSEQNEQIQTKIAYLEQATTELSDVVYRQQQEIQVLRHRLQLLIDRLGAPADETPRTPEQERPPHY
jgi:SlyX protein